MKWMLLKGFAVAAVLVGFVAGIGFWQLPAIGAGAVLHPAHRLVETWPPAGCGDAAFAGAGVTLRGWRCAAEGTRRGTVVYLHGIGDNRASAAGIVSRLGRGGFDVIAYDSRGHGASDEAACTYGYFEKEDLGRVLDTVGAGPIVLVGSSLGAAVALQHAAYDARVTAVVAAESFADLQTIVSERAPAWLPDFAVQRALDRAEQLAGLRVEAVSPAVAARSIRIPVLVVHGARDTETRPYHAQRIFDALAGPKQLLLAPNAGHNGALSAVWPEVERWIEEAVRSHRRRQ